ncbi:MAG: DUF1326 domain-containing protein [Acidobacteria bacterium]|nr:DUF1326 domain-containing protein [Acidobacteriota bacterium]
MIPAWRLRGLLFENCNCQLVCPGHMSFRQLCTHDRCIGLWALSIEEGSSGDTDLAGIRAAILFDTPQHMIAGGWTTALLVDEGTSEVQLEALANILDGRAGGPWAVLARFVEHREEPRRVPIHLLDEGRKKRMWVEGMFDTSIEAIRGRDKDGVAVLGNLFNQIHAPTQVLALGSSRCTDGRISFETENTHALYSAFAWEGP